MIRLRKRKNVNFVDNYLLSTMKTLFSILLFVSIFCSQAFAQRGYNNNYATWKIHVASSTFLSDLGGKPAIGTNDISDIDFKATRFALGGGLQFNYGALGINPNFFYTRLTAADSLTTNRGRAVRNLSVATDVVEVNVLFQFTIPTDIPVIGGLYFNAGGGLTYFDPKGYLNGEYYSLRPLGTEGQNYRPDRSPYPFIVPVIPFGLGYKIPLGHNSAISIDLSARKSFTDYYDDVSTTYGDNAAITANGGSIAGALADRSVRGLPDGNQRGDPNDKDNYFLLGLKFEKALGSGGGGGRGNTSCYYNNNWFGKNGTTPRIGRRGARRRLFR